MKTTRPWLVRLLPAAWRDSVWGDLEEEARSAGRSGLRAQLWGLWQVVRLSVSLRSAFSGDVTMSEIRYAFRSLIRARAFTLGAVFTVVLGLGVNVAVFAVVDRMLFRPLPFDRIDRLVTVAPYDSLRGELNNSFPRPMFVRGRTLGGVEDMASFGFTLGFARPGALEGEPPLGLTQATYNALRVLGVSPAIGRGFTREDAETNRGVALITFEAWRAKFGGASSVLGTKLGGRSPVEVIGVLPRGFIAPAMNRSGRMDGLFLMPDLLEGEGTPRDSVDPGVARLRDGETLASVQAQFDAVARAVNGARRPGVSEQVLRVEPLRAGMFWYGYRYFWILALAGSLVGLLACANLSALLMARGRSREHEMALRASLGASRGRLIAAEMTQGLLICAAAMLTSLVVLRWSLSAIRALVPGLFRGLVVSEIDGRIFLFAGGAAVVATVLSATIPAWRSSRLALLSAIQRSGGSPFFGRAGRSNRTVLALEAAMAVVLVAGAAAMVRSFVGLVRMDMGFSVAGVRELSFAAVDRPRYRQIIEAARQQPGVTGVGAVDSLPASLAAPWSGINVGAAGSMGLWQMTDGFLPAIGATFVAGRDVTPAEAMSSADVAVVSRNAARKFWPDVPDPSIVGRTIAADDGRTWTVVGVIADMRDRPDQPARPRVFVPLKGDRPRALHVAFRSEGEGPSIAAWRAALSACCGVPSVSILPTGAAVNSALEQPRVQAQMFGAFAAIALLLAALGLFAVVSFEVARRRYEIGVRMTLGATSGRIHRFVVEQAAAPVLVGVAAGLVAASWSGQFLQAFVYQVDAGDPATLGIVSVVIVSTAVLAAWLPARRAARTDPASVLRAQ